jgi:hypothetical protein
LDKVFVKLDFANAFNTMHRECFLQEVRNQMPGLAPWVDWCYGSPSKLVFGSSTLDSEAGVQQGDPLGPLLFALALQPILRDLDASRSQGGLELVFSYLDDVCLAGSSQAVSDAVTSMRAKANAVGLALSTGTPQFKDKCELILTAGVDSTVDVSLFPNDFKVIRDGNFELLGGPIGDPAFCNQHTQKRVDKACRLLEALGGLPDPMVALRLLRHCGGFCKMVFSARVAPSSHHKEALGSFDAAVRSCFEQFSCLLPDDDQWAQATLSTDSAGLGLRSLAKHGCAAFIASRTSCADLCRELDAQHTFLSPGNEACPEREAIGDFNANVNEDSRLPLSPTGPLVQRDLSAALDKRTFMQSTCSSDVTLSRRAHLNLASASGAGLWLHALPSKACGLHVEPAVYVTMLERWLRIPPCEADAWCPLCDGIMDRFGDHALTCCGGGDRTRRHNLIRNEAYYSAAAAGLQPELERPGLLPPRPLSGSQFEDGTRPTEADERPDARRPADVYVPRWRAGPAAAWDFAVTSGLQDNILVHSASDKEAALNRYEDYKSSFKSTRNLCQQAGFSFIPMILEATGGGWGKQARAVWSELAKKHALATGELTSDKDSAISLLQRLSLILHRENARAIMRRRGACPVVGDTGHASSLAATLAEEAASWGPGTA